MADGELKIRDEELSWRQVGDEIIVLDLRSNAYLSINQSGTALWDMLVEGTTSGDDGGAPDVRVRPRPGRRPDRCRSIPRDAHGQGTSGVTGVSHRGGSRLIALRRRAFAPAHTLIAGLWAIKELRHLRSTLARDGVRASVGRPPRRVSRRSGRVVMFAARVGNATCLERSLLRQAWLRGRGTMRDVVIGVRSEDEFEAHAWLDGDPDGAEYVEIHRIRSLLRSTSSSPERPS